MEVRAYWPSLSAFGIEPYRRLARWLQAPEETLIPESGFMGIGFLLTTVLMFFRMRFVWWPFHPAGFAISTSWGMHVTWSCLFMSWLIKWLILQYGGVVRHRKIAPFFLRVNPGRVHSWKSLDNHRDSRGNPHLRILGVTGYSRMDEWGRRFH